MQVDLSDKFGQNGIVSLLVGSLYKNSLIIENWVMSQQGAFKDIGTSYPKKIFADLEKNIEKIIGIYKPSVKNKLVIDHYKNLKFTMQKKTKEKNYLGTKIK